MGKRAAHPDRCVGVSASDLRSVRDMQREAAKERLAALRAENDRRTREAHALRMAAPAIPSRLTQEQIDRAAWARLAHKYVRKST